MWVRWSQADGRARGVFVRWREALNGLEVSGPVRAGYAVAISGNVDYCRRNGVSVTTESARG
jgi:hypothetical protein